jgi:hypothetical protein
MRWRVAHARRSCHASPDSIMWHMAMQCMMPFACPAAEEEEEEEEQQEEEQEEGAEGDGAMDQD